MVSLTKVRLYNTISGTICRTAYGSTGGTNHVTRKETALPRILPSKGAKRTMTPAQKSVKACGMILDTTVETCATQHSRGSKNTNRTSAFGARHKNTTEQKTGANRRIYPSLPSLGSLFQAALLAGTPFSARWSLTSDMETSLRWKIPAANACVPLFSERKRTTFRPKTCKSTGFLQKPLA